MERPQTEQLHSFVEGMIAGAMDWPRVTAAAAAIGWTVEAADVLGVHAVVFTAPSGHRWRIRAELIDGPVSDPSTV